MTTYEVIATIQSALPFSSEPPVDIRQYRGTNLAKALSAFASAATLFDPEDEKWTRLLSVRMDVTQPEPESSIDEEFGPA